MWWNLGPPWFLFVMSYARMENIPANSSDCTGMAINLPENCPNHAVEKKKKRQAAPLHCNCHNELGSQLKSAEVVYKPFELEECVGLFYSSVGNTVLLKPKRNICSFSRDLFPCVLPPWKGEHFEFCIICAGCSARWQLTLMWLQCQKMWPEVCQRPALWSHY